MTSLTHVNKNRTQQIASGLVLLFVVSLIVGTLWLNHRPLTAPISAPTEAAQTETAKATTVLDRAGTQMSVATALSNGAPSLIYFYPAETCQIRYCRQPVQVEAQLRQQHGQDINFVTVTVEAVPVDDTAAYQSPIFHNLGMYAVASTSEFLPEISETPWGIGLQNPAVSLVDARGTLVLQDGEFFAMEQVSDYLQVAASE